MIQWLNDRTGAVTGLKTCWYWTVPATKCVFRQIPIVIVFAFLVQAITGVIMWAHYSPSSQTAWESVFFFQYHIPFGWLIRGLHHYAAQLIVGILGFYILASIFRYSYRSPREFVFWGALILLLLSVCSCLTGDLMSWSLTGYSATLVRVRFLQMLPIVGNDLFKLVLGNPGPGFGTYTLTRFLVLHVMVFGGGFFAFLVLWRFFDFRARKIEIAQNAAEAVYQRRMAASSSEPSGANANEKPSKKAAKEERPKLAYFWSGQAFFAAVACAVFLTASLALVFQHDLAEKYLPHRSKAETAANDTKVEKTQADGAKKESSPTEIAYADWSTLPRESQLGAKLTSPADTASSYDAARPEWSFRALYHFSNMFSAEKKIYSIFVIPPLIVLFFFAVPIFGKFKPFRYLIMLITAAFFVAFLYMTYASYHHDWISDDYLQAEAETDELAVRSLELALRPEGIPPTGALSLLKNDPKIQGRAIFVRHCATCHAFEPQPGELPHQDFRPYRHPKPSVIPETQEAGAAPETWKATAPNLYNPISKFWMSGFLDENRLKSDQYFGGTEFKNGSMIKDVVSVNFPADEDQAAFQEDRDGLSEALYQEALLNAPRKMDGERPKGIHPSHYELIESFGCTDANCHKFYGLGEKNFGKAVDLTGYMSREWLIGAIANIGDPKYYGAKNTSMPVYFVEEKADSTLTLAEVELVADWLRGHWYRPNQSTTSAVPDVKNGISDNRRHDQENQVDATEKTNDVIDVKEQTESAASLSVEEKLTEEEQQDTQPADAQRTDEKTTEEQTAETTDDPPTNN
ncbi:MAG: cytochrome b N-terminal domain-containing protein [Planctomycetaceae bacterium]|jgi:ubiquinol-cytochrome c reductase cytochrome b subunit|nr:cytochrome b N-terminal domain-containing protein [Planctomycetaceae bacterium]